MTSKSTPAMNPTVEDEVDNADANIKSNKGSSTTNNTPVPWSEIFSRHEAVLCSHLEMLSMVKEQVASEVNGFQAVSSMVNKTVQAMNQLKVARKHMMSSKFQQLPPKHNLPHLFPKQQNPGIDMTALGNTTPSTSSNHTQSTDTDTNTRKKRRRVSEDKETVRPEPTDEMRVPKRYRDSSSQPATEQEGEYTSTSLGTEDISAEVQRRLKIKEEQRRRKENPKPDKRKRDSLASNDGEPAMVPRPRKKRLMVSNVHKRHGDLMDKDGFSAQKKLRISP
ncbi:uncharacterized protein N7500_001109 [Penicillium coprophilum]|uniref:uncharacterized protein n=1 Tax=Penicillium coprophilum TaxID=36646 RepID=UPI0023A0D388|nr:uncharacterized protein N7500_001109 [Penicillium coprophilum]KAJ5178410.1 hypothetical protein N7500_001109 [Penicillium coprophilum]